MQIRKLTLLAFFAAFSMLLVTPSAFADIEANDTEVVNSKRVSRFDVEYGFRLQASNTGNDAQNISAIVSSSSPNIIVVEEQISFDNMGAGESSSSTDTFTLRINRRVPFDATKLTYQFTFEDVPATDNDGDGFSVEAGDCDDTNPNINPGAIDTPNNGIDEDCSGADTIIGPGFAVKITEPASLATVGVTPTTVKGTVNDPNVVLTVNGVAVAHQNGQFEVNVALNEGLNSIVARGTKSDQQVTDSISISLDQTPPVVTIESHTNNQTVFSNKITVTGLINDIVRGTIETTQANVKVNNKQANISNRSYSATDITLVEGENTIMATGSDQVGNISSKSIKVVYKEPQGRRIDLVSGQNQSATINSELPEVLKVKVLDKDLLPVVNQAVIFRVVQGSGLVGNGSSDKKRAMVIDTDGNGMASSSFTLGSRVGSANHKVRVQVVNYDDEVIFNASASGKIGNKISVNSGNNQRGAVGQVLHAPLVAVVTDAGANVVAGARVEFKVTKGEGLLKNGTKLYETQTDSDGRATSELTLGYLTGLDAQRITATLIDAPPGQVLTTGFSATAFVPSDPGKTSVSGVVLDNQDNPIPGVTLRIDGVNRQAISDSQGQFKITESPVGPIHLIADGSTATVPGEFPSLSYNLVTISGVDNPLSAPIFMVKLDTANAILVGAQDTELTLAKYPGFKLEIAKDSVTFPDGSTQGLLSVTQVNANKVPMAPPNGMQPQFIVTIQPTNTKFDPPARLTLPNMDGFPSGEQVEMYSYDHQLEEFVSIGLGTVSDDGSTVKSNPGVGVVKAGWHCGSQPGGQGCAHNCPVCQDCDANCNCFNADNDPRVDVCKKCKNGSAVDKKINDVKAKHDGKETDATILLTKQFKYSVSVGSHDCDALEYEWDFGDGNSATSASGNHVYAAKGVYTAKVTVKCTECNSVMASDQIKITVAEVTLITPKGDPATAADDSGDGQNEFTFSAASPGILTVNFKAKVEPATADLNQINEMVFFTLEKVGKDPTWDAANPGGRSSVSGTNLIAKATISGLPAKNTDFGKKKTELKLDGTVSETVTIEVFFPRVATNNPGATDPNWFYYWNQTAAGDPDTRYDNSANFGETPAMLNWSTYAGARARITVSDAVTGSDSRRDGTAQVVTGIDLFANTVAHENQHVAQINSNNGLAFYSGVTGVLREAAKAGWSFNVGRAAAEWNHFTDTDGNGILSGGDTDLDANSNDFGDSIEIPLVGCVTQTVPLMIECDAEKKETIAEDTHKNVDWGNPGKQHQTSAYND